MGRAWFIASVLGFTIVAVLAVEAGGVQEDRFPHERHQGLFPLCAGCHQGVEGGADAAFYPDPTLCARCHDGGDLEEVRWEGPARQPSNVEFRHEVHAALLEAEGDPPQSCEACHSASTELRMSVDTAEELDTCWSCHAHETPDHFDLASQCETCHVPLAQTPFDSARVEALPAPESHEGPVFLAEVHGASATGYADRCATCHTSNVCVACHVDATLLEISAIPAAPPGMRVQPIEAHYPEPASHIDEGWLSEHGVQAPVRECSTCHTQDDCRSCHVGLVPAQVEGLRRRADVVAPGVGLQRAPPGNHASPFYMQAHSVLAAADDRSCATCHQESYCVDCHDGPSDGGYHPPSFITRHAATAFARTDECATCHSTEVFCRSCHEDVGLRSVGRLGAGYHDAEPIWLLRHGQAARQSLESCASCHRQNDCVQCHGLLGAFSVSPHTRDFNAREAWARSPRTCLACHVTNPLGVGGP